MHYVNFVFDNFTVAEISKSTHLLYSKIINKNRKEKRVEEKRIKNNTTQENSLETTNGE